MNVPSALTLLTACSLALLLPAAEPAAPVQPTVIKSHTFDMRTVGNETRSVFDGLPDRQVSVTGTNLTIVCDHLEVIAVGVEDRDAAVPTLDKFKYLLATGRVRIVQGDREATCGRAEIFPRDDKLVLTEKPVVVDHGINWRGAGREIIMRRGDRHVQIIDSEFEGPPIRDLGFDKDQPAKAPATAPAAAPAVTVPGLTPPKK